MFRLMLDAHPEISNPAETDFLFDYLHRRPDGSWAYDLDELRLRVETMGMPLKLPDGPSPDHDGRALLADMLRQLATLGQGRLTLNIHRHLDRIAELLPQARVIHFLRDPRDVARSCIGMGWAGTPYHGVTAWIGTEDSWDRCADKLAPERVLEVRYEDLVDQPREILEHVAAFLGVTYDPAMLSYPENTTYETPDARLIAQWRHKLSEDDLALVEGKLGARLEAKGYAPSGVPPRSPGRIEKTRLNIANKLAVWRFAAKRYGAGLVLAEKLSRRAGLVTLNQRLRTKISHRARAYLK